MNIIFCHLVIYFVGFSSSSFSGSEGSTSTVSLFVSQPAPFDISLTLQATDNTATSMENICVAIYVHCVVKYFYHFSRY